MEQQLSLLPNHIFDGGEAPTAAEGGGKRKTKKNRTPGQARAPPSAAPTIIKMPNGLRLVYEKSPSSKVPLTSIQCFVHLGSINEEENSHGVSHLLEHMCFKGTKKLPSSVEVSYIYDKTGAYMNAYTIKQVTCYLIKCQSEFVVPSIGVLSDMMFHTVFKKKDFEKEYEVVIEEAKRYADDIYNDVEEKMDEILFQGTTYANPVDTLRFHKKRISMKTMIEFYKKYYVPQNMVLSIVSSLDFSAILAAVKKSYFYDTKLEEIPVIVPTPIGSLVSYTSPQIDIKKKMDLTSILVGIGFRTCSTYNPDKYALNIIKNILIGPKSSYFFKNLRDDNGLTYNTYITLNHFEHTGSFTIYTQISREKLFKNNAGGGGDGLLPLIFKILHKLKRRGGGAGDGGIQKKEFELAKGYLRGILIRHTTDNDNLAEHNGLQQIFHSNTPPFSYVDKYEHCYKNITLEEVNRVYEKYFTKENTCLYVYGSLPGEVTEKNLEKIVDIL